MPNGCSTTVPSANYPKKIPPKASKSPPQRGTRPFSDEALKELVHVSHGYPYFIQAYGKAAWNVSDSNPISLDSVKRSEPIARAELDHGTICLTMAARIAYGT